MEQLEGRKSFFPNLDFEFGRIQHRSLKLLMRKSIDNDVPGIRVLVNRAYRELADLGLNYTAAYQDEETTRERIRRGRAFVLLLGAEIIGTVLISSQNQFTNRMTGYISQLAVAPKFKRAGIGSLLMDWCEGFARAKNFADVQLDTAKPAEHLVKWYLSRGYVIVGETHWEGKTYDSWIFEKSLRRPNEK